MVFHFFHLLVLVLRKLFCGRVQFSLHHCCRSPGYLPGVIWLRVFRDLRTTWSLELLWVILGVARWEDLLDWHSQFTVRCLLVQAEWKSSANTLTQILIIESYKLSSLLLSCIFLQRYILQSQHPRHVHPVHAQRVSFSFPLWSTSALLCLYSGNPSSYRGALY